MTLRNVIVLAVLALLCVVGIFLIQEGGGPSTALPAVWPQFQRSEVTALTIEGQGSRLELRRREGNADRWDVVQGTELVRADANAIDDLLAALSRQSVRDRVERSKITDADIAGWGLAQPGVGITLTVGGKPLELRYGKPTREGTKVYMDTGAGTDVWVVPRDAFDLAISAFGGDQLRDKRVFDSALFDVAKLEIVKRKGGAGVTTVAVSRDLDQVWHIEQPFRGFANPKTFETELSRIVNAKLERWAEPGAAPDLVKYGLETPAYEVRIVPRGEGRKPEVLLVGDQTPEGSVFVREEGTRTVVVLPKSFADTLLAAERFEWRDRSFTRLGHGGVGVDVKLGTVLYKLEKAGSTWDVTIGSERRPADGEKVNRLLDLLRAWQTVEFLDGQKPEDFGIDGKDWVVIEREGSGREAGPKITLLFGRRAPDDKSVYAQRKDDGGVERVDAAPYDALTREGAKQFFRSSARGTGKEIPIDAVDRIARNPGPQENEEAKGIHDFVVERNLDGEDRTWKSVSGLTGTLDANVLNEILKTLQAVHVVEWVQYEAHRGDGERLGFSLRYATMAIELRLAHVHGPESDEIKLYVGKRRPEGGYYARFDDSGGWAFVLSDDVVNTLKKKLTTGD